MKNRFNIAMACMLVVATVLVGCATLGLPQATTFNERLAAGYTTVTAVRDATSAYMDAKVAKISAQPESKNKQLLLVAVRVDAQSIQDQADKAKQGLDVAGSLKAIDLKSAEARLSSTLVILQALQDYLNKEK